MFDRIETMSRKHSKFRPLIFFFAWLVALSIVQAAPSMPTSPRADKAAARVEPALKAELAKRGLALGAPIFIRIFKAEATLEIWAMKEARYTLFKQYPTCYFSGGLGPKTKKGDGQAPEGFYQIAPRQLNPYSQFHLSFDLGYPNAYDRAHGRTGSLLMVHGNCASIGCYAMGDAQIEEIYTLVVAALRGGQPHVHVHAFPFRMGDPDDPRFNDPQWGMFWRNLRDGYEFFGRNKLPPTIAVKNKTYAFK